MGSSTRIVRLAVLVAVALVIAAAAAALRQKRQQAESTVQSIHDQLEALDPATRAAVVARLTADEVRKVRSQEQ